MQRSLIVNIMVLAALFAAAPASAQMRFVRPGNNGFGTHVGVMRGDASMGFGAGTDATILDRVDLGLSIERIYLDKYFRSDDASVTAVTPRLSVGLVRSPQSGTGVELSVSYEMDYFTSDWLVERDLDLFTKSLTGMVSFYVISQVSPAMKFYPELGAGYMSEEGTLSGPGKGGTDSDASGFAFRVGASMFFNEKVRFTPAVLVIDGDATWTTTMGLEFSGG